MTARRVHRLPAFAFLVLMMFLVYLVAVSSRLFGLLKSHFRIVVLVVGYVSAAGGGLFLLERSNSTHSADAGLQRQLEFAESLNRLLLQQVDATFELAMESYFNSDNLTEEQLRFFESWQRYDQEYVDRVRQQPSSLYVQATASARRGRAFMVLDKPKLAIEQYGVATELLSQLIGAFPKIPCYTIDLVSVRMMTAQSLHHLQAVAEAKAELILAEQVIEDSQLQRLDDTEQLFSYLQNQILRQREELELRAQPELPTGKTPVTAPDEEGAPTTR